MCFGVAACPNDLEEMTMKHRAIHAEIAEDKYRAMMNEITRLMGAIPGSVQAERLTELTRLAESSAHVLLPDAADTLSQCR